MSSITMNSLIINLLLRHSDKLIRPPHLHLHLHPKNMSHTVLTTKWRSLASFEPPSEFPQRRIPEVDPTTPIEMPEFPKDLPEIDPTPPEFIIPGEIGPPQPPPDPIPNPPGPEFPSPPIPSPPGPDVIPPAPDVDPSLPHHPPDVVPPTPPEVFPPPLTPPPDINPPTGPVVV